MSSSRSDVVTQFVLPSVRPFFRPFFSFSVFGSCSVSRMFQLCFKEVSRVFQGSFNGVLRKSQMCSKKLHICFKKFTRKIGGCFEGVLRVFPGCFIIFKGVSKVFQESFKKTFKMFQKSLILHGTHLSFPSRSRAC